MSKPLKKVLCIVVVVALVGALAFAIYKIKKPYNPDRFIGLTYDQIVARYGEFDFYYFKDPETGIYAYGYIVKGGRMGVEAINPPIYFIVYFNENGVAYTCQYDHGGWGG